MTQNRKKVQNIPHFSYFLRVICVSKVLPDYICLTLFWARQGRFDPQHHTYVCSFNSNRDRLTKIGDFVSITI